MGLKAGIIGLPNVGKSTLFNAITNLQIEVANYPFATIEPNVGIVSLKDKRLDKIAEIVQPQKIIYATFEFIDIAGLIKGASQGEGLGNKFLDNIKEVDALVHVVRCFEDDVVTHVSKKINPLDDLEVINTELLISDLEVLTNVISRLEKKFKKTSSKIILLELNMAIKFKKKLEEEIPLRSIEMTNEEIQIIKGWNLLTQKPMIYVGNISEKYVSNPQSSTLYQILEKEALKQKCKVIGVSAKIESEISQLSNEEKKFFLQDLGISNSGLEKITRESFEALGLSTYFTAGIKEVRAWTFRNGMTASQCAGIIHTDFERGFIKAQVTTYSDYIQNGGELETKNAGKYRMEGKNYIFQDGDITEFKFNV